MCIWLPLTSERSPGRLFSQAISLMLFQTLRSCDTASNNINCTILYETASYNKLQVSIRQINDSDEYNDLLHVFRDPANSFCLTWVWRWISLYYICFHNAKILPIRTLSVPSFPQKEALFDITQRKRAQLTSSISAVPTVLSCLTRFLF